MAKFLPCMAPRQEWQSASKPEENETGHSSHSSMGSQLDFVPENVAAWEEHKGLRKSIPSDHQSRMDLEKLQSPTYSKKYKLKIKSDQTGICIGLSPIKKSRVSQLRQTYWHMNRHWSTIVQNKQIPSKGTQTNPLSLFRQKLNKNKKNGLMMITSMMKMILKFSCILIILLMMSLNQKQLAAIESNMLCVINQFQGSKVPSTDVNQTFDDFSGKLYRKNRPRCKDTSKC